MALLGGDNFDPRPFFKGDCGIVCASSVDLTVGTIFDADGRDVGQQIRLQPGRMVIVISKQVFDLPNTITAHVTYKTTLTKRGIWALTVGIVDPGWNAPVGTSLLNFSRQDFLVEVGAPFLRVSFHEHGHVADHQLRRCTSVAAYVADLRSTAATQLPPSFLDRDQIAADAKKEAAKEMAKAMIGWGTGASLLIGGVALGFQLLGPKDGTQEVVSTMGSQVRGLSDDVRDLDGRLSALERRRLAQASGENDSDLRGLSPDATRRSNDEVAK